jgi:hypothetical protein
MIFMQEFAAVTRVQGHSWVPSHQLQTIPITWPFSTWRLDLVGPFKKAKGGFIHIFVAVDKFIKWIKVKHAATITSAKVVEFIKEIIYRFGIPNNIITDNGTQFMAKEFEDFCADSGIKLIMPTCHTHRARVKWSTQMAWFSKG